MPPRKAKTNKVVLSEMPVVESVKEIMEENVITRAFEECQHSIAEVILLLLS